MRKYVLSAMLMLIALPAFAEEAEKMRVSLDTAMSAAANTGVTSSLAIAIGLMMAIAPLGGAIGQGLAAQAALNGIARNPAAQPKLFIPMIIALALIESLVIYALVISFGLSGTIEKALGLVEF